MKKLLVCLAVIAVIMSPVTSSADDSLAKDIFLKTSLTFSLGKFMLDKCYRDNDVEYCKEFQKIFSMIINDMNNEKNKQQWRQTNKFLYEGLTEYVKSKGYLN